jgi:hypothetical protein
MSPTWAAPSTAYRGKSSIAFAASLRIARHLADHDRVESSQYHAAWCTKPCIADRIVVNFDIDAKLSDPYQTMSVLSVRDRLFAWFGRREDI